MDHSSAVARRAPHGFTIIEATLATLIVSVTMFAAVTGAARSIANCARAADRVKAQELALDMMSEILNQNYQDGTPSPVIALLPGASPTCRAAWDCVDDYNGWTEVPPQTAGGLIIPDTTGLTRSVKVQWVNPTNMLPTTTPLTGIKMITVTVSRSSLVLASISAYRTIGWVTPSPNPNTATSAHPPTAVAALDSGYSSLSGTAPFTVGLTGAASSSPAGNVLSYAWNFGDGSNATGATATHTYASAGMYSVTLTVDDGCGGVGVTTVTVNSHN